MKIMQIVTKNKSAKNLANKRKGIDKKSNV